MKNDKTTTKERKHKRIRKKIRGTRVKPRLSVFRSNRHVYVQLIDDDKGNTLALASDIEIKKKEKINVVKNINVKEAFEVGKLIAQKAIKYKVKNISFDRGGVKYHGIVKSVADGAREGGLIF